MALEAERDGFLLTFVVVDGEDEGGESSDLLRSRRSAPGLSIGDEALAKTTLSQRGKVAATDESGGCSNLRGLDMRARS